MGKVFERCADVVNLMRGRAPGQLIIQLTDRCNARCPQCGMRVINRYKRTRLSTDAVKRMLDAGAKRGMRMVSFTGGEPLLLLDDLIELINYAGKAGFRYIRTGTNGFLFRNHEDPRFSDHVHNLAQRLAATPLRNFWISIDSAEADIHDDMRGFPGVTAGIRKALPIFHAHGLYPSANVGLNRNLTSVTALTGDVTDAASAERFYHSFRAGLEQLYRMILDLGFTMTSACYPMSIEPDASDLQAVYGATASERLVRFSAREKVLLYQALADTVPAFRSRLRIVTPLSSLHSLVRQYGDGAGPCYGCRGGSEYLFVDCVKGLAYPCGYRGAEPLGPVWKLNRDALRANGKAVCRRCDWECFRDPSELFGPILQGLSRPLELLRNYRDDNAFYQLWRQDLQYARACNFYDGRLAPDFSRLEAQGDVRRTAGMLVHDRREAMLEGVE